MTKEIVGMASDLPITEIMRQGSELDDAFFRANPDRSFNIRRILSGEYPAPATHVLAARVEPWMTVRHSFQSPDADPDNSSDMQAEMIWQKWGNKPLSKAWGRKVKAFNREKAQ